MRIKFGALGLALTTRRALAALASPPHPDDRCRDADPEPHRRRAGRSNPLRFKKHTVSKILPVRLRRGSLRSTRRMKHDQSLSGLPNESEKAEPAVVLN